MPKGLVSSAVTYARNLTKHAKRVATGAESAKEAMTGLSRDTKKLKHKLAGSKGEDDHRRSAKLTERGRAAFNHREYEKAEEKFRLAIIEDPDYALPRLYLGHALYKQGRLDEAVSCWKHTIRVAPRSDEAAQARQKIDHVALSMHSVASQLERKLRGRTPRE